MVVVAVAVGRVNAFTVSFRPQQKSEHATQTLPRNGVQQKILKNPHPGWGEGRLKYARQYRKGKIQI